MKEKVIKHRNLLGSIYEHWVIKNGRKKKAFDARKRYTPPEGGKRKQKFKRCWSRSEANTALVNFHNEIAQEFIDFENKKNKTEEHAFAEIVEYYKKEYVKPAVIRNGRKISGYKRQLKPIIYQLDCLNEYFGEMNIRDISYEDVRQYKTGYENTITKRGEYPSAATVNERLSILRRLLKIAIQKNWLDASPFSRGASLIDKAAEVRRTRLLTFAEEKRLLDACEPHIQTTAYDRTHKNTKEREEVSRKIFVDRSHLIPLIICALDTAMRVGEIFNLRWKQVDLENRVIYLTGADAQSTKTGVAGILPVTERLYKILEARFNDQKPEETVFPKFNYKRSFKSACAEAGIKDFQVRDCRAAAITRMMMSGVSGDIVRKISRHTTDKIFLAHYTRIDEANAQAVGESLDNYITAQQKKVRKTAEQGAKLRLK